MEEEKDLNLKTLLEEEYETKPLKSTPSSGWGDSEHDTVVHSHLRAHSNLPSYDSRWKNYRREE